MQSVGLARDIADQQREYVLSKQFLRSATSIGANIEEGLQGQSRKDFISKMSIALKEAYESRYWLRIMHASKLGQQKQVISLEKDITELIAVLVRIVKTSRKEK